MEKDFHTSQLAKPTLRFINFIIDTLVIAVVYNSLNSHYQITQEPGTSRFNILTVVIFITYYTMFEWLTGKTIGKFLTKTKVIMENGSKISLGIAFLKSALRLIPLIQWTYLGKVCSGFPDSFTNTIVIPDKEVEK
jgi:uncharacterized RDD family membrane protein YckC